jgi:hypothetical protein
MFYFFIVEVDLRWLNLGCESLTEALFGHPRIWHMSESSEFRRQNSVSSDPLCELLYPDSQISGYLPGPEYRLDLPVHVTPLEI